MKNIMVESKIDTNRFGFRVSKTNGELFRNISIEKSKELCSDFKLVIARVSLEDVELVNILEDIGFRIKDTQITYKHNLTNLIKDGKISDGITIRDFNESDTPTLVEMARNSFKGYGHYFKNHKLDKNRCLEVYEDWAYNTCTNKEFADKIIVACINNKPSGFLSFKIYDKANNEKYAAGGIGAVDVKQRGKNIFPKILKAGLEWSLINKLDWCEHNVIVNNFPVNRSMNKAGFKPTSPVITMHLTNII